MKNESCNPSENRLRRSKFIRMKKFLRLLLMTGRFVKIGLAVIDFFSSASRIIQDFINMVKFWFNL